MPKAKETSFIEPSIIRLFSVPKLDEPSGGDSRREYAASASAVYQSKPFNVLVVEMRNELMRLAVVHDRNTESGDWVRGAIYCLDQLHQRFEMLDGEHRQFMSKNEDN